MGQGDPPIRDHDHQIPQAQFEARVPAHAPNDNLPVEVPSSEQIFDRDEPLHLSIIARHPCVCTRAVAHYPCHRLPSATIIHGTHRLFRSSSQFTCVFPASE